MSKAASNHPFAFSDHPSTSAPNTKFHTASLDDDASPLSGLSSDRLVCDDWRGSGDAIFGHDDSFGSPGTKLAVFAGNDTDIHLVNVPAPHVVNEAGSPAGSSASGSGTGTGGTALITNAASAFVINVTYDSSVDSAPAAFKTAVAAVVQYFETQFTDPITINIAVGYGEAGGSSLGGALGMSMTYLTNTSYASLRSALSSDAKTADDATAVASLPGTDPTGTNHYWLATAEAKALGLAVPTVPVDGYVGFSTTAAFDFDNSNGVTAGQYDFFGVVAHEISEVMGRFLMVGESIGTSSGTIANNYDALDLFHYSNSGVRDFVGTTAGYFSLNSGTTKLYDFNTNPGGDFGDLAASAGNNSFLAFANAGVTLPVTGSDVKIMDAIGWDAAASNPPPPPPPPPPPADLIVSSLTLHDTTVSFQIHNSGTGSAAASTAGIYLSTDSTITTSDILLATVSTSALAANGSFNASVGLSFPSNLAQGTYRIGVIADYNNQITESSETNNASTTSLPVLLGNSSVNVLTGTSGNDTIIGLGSGDTLIGGAGKDTLIGNSGSDHFRYNAKTDGLDTIVDFSTSNDVLDFSRAAFGAGLATGGASIGTLSASHFVASASGNATAGTAQFLYNTTTHILSFDADGTGVSSALQLAQLENGVLIGSTNIHLV